MTDKKKDKNEKKEVELPGFLFRTKIFKRVYSVILLSNAAGRVFNLKPKIQWGSVGRNRRLLSF